VIGRSVVEVMAAEPLRSDGAGAPWEASSRPVVLPARRAVRRGLGVQLSVAVRRDGAGAGRVRARLVRQQRPLLEGRDSFECLASTKVTFDPGSTTIATPVTRVLADRRGVCQDFAHLQIACLRSLGLAARYVSGYLLTEPPAGQPRLVGADASHAWLSIWCPPLGWVES